VGVTAIETDAQSCGIAMKDDAGKIRYAPFIEFRSKEIRDRWSSAVIDALRAAHPEAFE
jgi:hypothetical protein